MKDLCVLIEEIWPLYEDGDLSEASRRLVARHLKECPNCRRLNKENGSMQALRELTAKEAGEDKKTTVSPAGTASPTGPARFLLRLKRNLQIAVVAVLIGSLLLAGGTWYYTDWSAQQTYRQEIEAERRAFQEQVLALEEVSPPAQALLEQLGVSFSADATKVEEGDGLVVKYRLRASASSPVTWIATTDILWFSADALFDAASGSPLRLDHTRSGASTGKYDGELHAQTSETEQVVLKTRPFYLFVAEAGTETEDNEGSAQDLGFSYSGGEKTIQINQPLSVGGVDFIIDSLDLNDDDFSVNYRQLTPAKEAGTHMLIFSFDDRLGNRWTVSPGEAPLSVTNPKQFSVAAPRSPAKSWLLKVDYLVRVVPGLNTTLSVKGGE